MGKHQAQVKHIKLALCVAEAGSCLKVDERHLMIPSCTQETDAGGQAHAAGYLLGSSPLSAAAGDGKHPVAAAGPARGAQNAPNGDTPAQTQRAAQTAGDALSAESGRHSLLQAGGTLARSTQLHRQRETDFVRILVGTDSVSA